MSELSEVPKVLELSEVSEVLKVSKVLEVLEIPEVWEVDTLVHVIIYVYTTCSFHVYATDTKDPTI